LAGPDFPFDEDGVVAGRGAGTQWAGERKRPVLVDDPLGDLFMHSVGGALANKGDRGADRGLAAVEHLAAHRIDAGGVATADAGEHPSREQGHEEALAHAALLSEGEGWACNTAAAEPGRSDLIFRSRSRAERNLLEASTAPAASQPCR